MMSAKFLEKSDTSPAPARARTGRDAWGVLALMGANNQRVRECQAIAPYQPGIRPSRHVHPQPPRPSHRYSSAISCFNNPVGDGRRTTRPLCGREASTAPSGAFCGHFLTRRTRLPHQPLTEASESRAMIVPRTGDRPVAQGDGRHTDTGGAGSHGARDKQACGGIYGGGGTDDDTTARRCGVCDGRTPVGEGPCRRGACRGRLHGRRGGERPARAAPAYRRPGHPRARRMDRRSRPDGRLDLAVRRPRGPRDGRQAAARLCPRGPAAGPGGRVPHAGPPPLEACPAAQGACGLPRGAGPRRAYGIEPAHVPAWLEGRREDGSGKGVTPIPRYAPVERSAAGTGTPPTVTPPSKPDAVSEYERVADQGGWHDEVGWLLLFAGGIGAAVAVSSGEPLGLAALTLVPLAVVVWVAGHRQEGARRTCGRRRRHTPERSRRPGRRARRPRISRRSYGPCSTTDRAPAHQPGAHSALFALASRTSDRAVGWNGTHRRGRGPDPLT